MIENGVFECPRCKREGPNSFGNWEKKEDKWILFYYCGYYGGYNDELYFADYYWKGNRLDCSNRPNNDSKACWERTGGSTEEKWNKDYNYEWKCYKCNFKSTNFKDFIPDTNESKMKKLNDLAKKFRLDNHSDEIEIIYEFPNDYNTKLTIFGETFVMNNKYKCLIIYKNQFCELEHFLNDIPIASDYRYTNPKKTVSIKLKGINNITNMSEMFYECDTLLSLPDISKWNTENITSMKGIFFRCGLLASLPDISKWNLYKVNDISKMFSCCYSIRSLPDISRWNLINVKDMNHMFYNCRSIISLPDISRWNLSNVEDISSLFDSCGSLTSLPDISKWNVSKIKYMNSIFSYCIKLISLPDISRWDLSSVQNMSFIFENCESIISLPDISKWNTFNVTDMKAMFHGCKNLIFLPDISKWNTSNVEKISYLFKDCESLISLPGIYKWNTKKINESTDMFDGCKNCKNITPSLIKLFKRNAKKI